MNRPWYIDFRGDPMMLSKVDIAKNLIIEDVDKANTQVFWEVRHFAKAISKDNDKFRIGPWWAHQRYFFEKLRLEFNLNAVELRPCRGSTLRNKGKTHARSFCTTETLLGTKGMLLMLLHWATNFKTKAGRAEAKAILQDLFRHAFLADDEHNERLICLPTSAIVETKIDWTQTDVNSRPASTARSIEYLFANRQDKVDIRVQLTQWLNVLTDLMNKVVTNGKMGQLNTTTLPAFVKSEHEKSFQTQTRHDTITEMTRKTCDSLTEELVMSWNEKWTENSMYTFKELLMAMRRYVNEKMDANMTVDKGEFDSWLRKHGWMKQEVERTNWWIKGSLICQRPWYIDFAYDPCRRSELDCTKNVIILTGDESVPEVY